MPLTDKTFQPLSCVFFNFFCHLPTFAQAHRLTPDFPESLYELLCTLQEGRRLNDQRCSFRLESGMRRRRCHSEPNAIKPVNRGRGFSSFGVSDVLSSRCNWCSCCNCFQVTLLTHVDQAETTWNYQFSVTQSCFEICVTSFFSWPLTTKSPAIWPSNAPFSLFSLLQSYFLPWPHCRERSSLSWWPPLKPAGWMTRGRSSKGHRRQNQKPEVSEAA